MLCAHFACANGPALDPSFTLWLCVCCLSGRVCQLRIDVFRPRTGDAQSPLQEPALQLLQLHFQDLSEDDLVAPQRFCVVLRQLGDGDDGRVDSGAKKDGSAAAVAASLLHVCVCTVLPSQPVIDAHVTTHHTLVVQWCATKEEMQQRGYAQLVLVGQLNWMAGEPITQPDKAMQSRESVQPLWSTLILL